MSTNNQATILVARFLKSHGYSETLDALIREANLAADAGTTNKGDLTIEKVLEEKKVFDVSLNFEKLGVDEGKRWRDTAALIPHPISGPTSSNILHLSFACITTESSSDLGKQLLLATTADRRLNVLNVPACTLQDSLTTLQDSPILSCALLKGTYLLTGSMSGRVAISDVKGKVLDQRRDHNKYVVHIAVHETSQTTLVATAGWDSMVHLYDVRHDNGAIGLGQPYATITLPTNPEAILFIEHPDNGKPVLIVTRRDSTHLYYHNTESGACLIGKQNIAPHANSWTHLTPSSIAICPTDSTLIAIATSALPHMKLLIVRLLLPPWTRNGQAPGSALLLDDPQRLEQGPGSAAREILALQDRETAAIQIHCTTMAPQTAYSTPALAWRPDGCGVWVNSDDGVIRGIEASTGKVVATLKGHDVGTKIRCLCSGLVESNGSTEEWLVSGGFDQKLIVWKPAE